MRRRKMLWLAGLTALVAGSVAVSSATNEVEAAAGGWSAVGGGIDGDRVFQVVRLPDGTLFAGGTFTSARNSGAAVAGTARIAQFDPTTSAWSALGAGVNGSVYALAYDPASENLWVGGAFTTAGGTAQNRLARWNVSTPGWVATPAVVLAGSGQNWEGVEAIAVLGTNNVLIGGGISNNTDVGRGILQFDGTGTLKTVAGGLNANSLPQRIVNRITPIDGGGALLGGQFTAVSGSAIASRRVAQFDGTQWVTSSASAAFGGSTSGPLAVVAAVASTSAGVVVGGLFEKVQNNSTDVAGTSRLAMWDGTAWVSIGTVEGAVIEELRVIGDYLYAGGEFTKVGGVAANNIARAPLSSLATGAKWEAITHGCLNGVNAVVRSITDAGEGNGSIYVGGGFTGAGGVPSADRIAKYSPNAPSCPSGGAVVLPTPTNFQLAGIVREQVDGRWGMRVHLSWEANPGYTFFTVSTAGRRFGNRFQAGGTHSDLSCWSTSRTCSIFFPFTSNTRSMHTRQYHEVQYTLQAMSAFAAGATLTLGPLTDLAPKPPSAPTGVRAQVGFREITVTWDRPEVDPDNGPIMNYLVRSVPEGKVCITRVTTVPENETARRCTFKNLKPGLRQRFQVQAFNLNGSGELSERGPSSALVPQDLQILSSERSGPQLTLLGGTRVRVEGAAYGYPTGTRVIPQVRIGDNPWRTLNGRRDPVVRVNTAGKFNFTHNVGLFSNRRIVEVRFQIGDDQVCKNEATPAISCGSSRELRFTAR